MADVEGGGYSGVVRLRMCDPRGAVSRIIAMDGWMEQQLEGERDAAVALAEKAETGWKASRAELDLSRKTARKEREALEAKLREERRKDHLAIRTVRLAVHEAQEQCAHLGQRLKTTGWQYTCERKKVLRLEKQLAKVKEEFSDLQAEHVASKRSNVDAHSLLNRRDVAVTKLQSQVAFAETRYREAAARSSAAAAAATAASAERRAREEAAAEAKAQESAALEETQRAKQHCQELHAQLETANAALEQMHHHLQLQSETLAVQMKAARAEVKLLAPPKQPEWTQLERLPSAAQRLSQVKSADVNYLASIFQRRAWRASDITAALQGSNLIDAVFEDDRVCAPPPHTYTCSPCLLCVSFVCALVVIARVCLRADASPCARFRHRSNGNAPARPLERRYDDWPGHRVWLFVQASGPGSCSTFTGLRC